MKNKAFIRFSSIVIPAIVLVILILVTLKPVTPGTISCKILPDTPADRDAYTPEETTWTVECPIKPEAGVSGCLCAEQWCTYWCQNNICNWGDKVKIAKAVCNIETAMPHCTGGVTCPEAHTPCNGETIGLVPAGGCCISNSDCATNKCTIEARDKCYGWRGYITHSTKLIQNPGLKCACSNLGEPCRKDEDCCDINNICGLDNKCKPGTRIPSTPPISQYPKCTVDSDCCINSGSWVNCVNPSNGINTGVCNYCEIGGKGCTYCPSYSF